MSAKRKIKALVPTLVFWWRSFERHPLNVALGEELVYQRERRGWSLDDEHDATGISKSHLWDLEHGRHSISLDIIQILEALYGMAPEGLLTLARRRMMKNPVILQMIRSV